jgi:hypothetical protein
LDGDKIQLLEVAKADFKKGRLMFVVSLKGINMKGICAIIIVFVLPIGICFAHRDSLVSINENGSLEGIPEEFGPASLHVEFSSQKKDSSPVISITLNLGKNSINLPRCLTSMLRTKSLSHIRASASWYHNETISLPYYLTLLFCDPDNKKDYELDFNLHNAKLMRINRKSSVKNGTKYQTVDLSKCKSEELKSLADDSGDKVK